MRWSSGVAVAAFAALVAVMLSVNLAGERLNQLFIELPGIDKAVHFGFHAILFLCLHRAASLVTNDRRVRSALALAAGVAIAAADEIVQGFTPARTVEAADVVADLAGLAFAWAMTIPRSRLLAATLAGSAAACGAYVIYDTHARLIEYSRGLRLERRHDFGGAYEHYRRALANGLRTPNLYNALAWAQVESGRGDPREAVEYARLALAEHPGSADILDTYGWALHRAGRSAEALQPLLDAYARNPRIFCIHYHLADVYLALGREDLAREHFRRQVTRSDTREAALAREALARLETRR